MSFERILDEAAKGKDFGSAPYLLASKKRPHVSRSKIEDYGNVSYLEVGDLKTARYEDDSSMRYVAAKDLTYDLLFSIYDVNTNALACARVFMNAKELEPRLSAFVGQFRRPNFEARIIGLQNGGPANDLKELLGFIARERIGVFEVDLFGEDTRHIAVDAKVGMSFNILIEDRLYKPGELTNKLTFDQFQRSLKGRA